MTDDRLWTMMSAHFDGREEGVEPTPVDPHLTEALVEHALTGKYREYREKRTKVRE